MMNYFLLLDMNFAEFHRNIAAANDELNPETFSCVAKINNMLLLSGQLNRTQNESKQITMT